MLICGVSLEPLPEPKKTKKASKLASSSTSNNFNDTAALDRRAQRFQREHELERLKTGKANHPNSRLFNTVPVSRNISPYGNGGEDPDADPVSLAHLWAWSRLLINPAQNVLDWDRDTIVGTSTALFKDYLRLTSVRLSVLHASSDHADWFAGT